jgi:hypothetical protein
MLQFIRGPSLKDQDIPSSKTLRAEILSRADCAMEKIKHAMKVCRFFSLSLHSSLLISLQNACGCVSFTIDTWTSENGYPYLSVTGHYIAEGPTEQPHDWILHSEQLGFVPFNGHHSGANMSNVITQVVDRYEIPHEKV